MSILVAVRRDTFSACFSRWLPPFHLIFHSDLCCPRLGVLFLSVVGETFAVHKMSIVDRLLSLDLSDPIVLGAIAVVVVIIYLFIRKQRGSSGSVAYKYCVSRIVNFRLANKCQSHFEARDWQGRCGNQC